MARGRGEGPMVGMARGRGSDPVARVTRGRGADPMAGVERVLVDGSNLAHALARGRPGTGSAPASGAPGSRMPPPTPPAGVIASIRAVFPPTVRVEVVFDGPGTPARAASNLWVEHSGRRSADRVIDEAVEAQLRADGPGGTWGILVVTDDRELRDLVQRHGARVAGTAWLAGRVTQVGVSRGPSGTSIGHRRPPRAPGAPDRR